MNTLPFNNNSWDVAADIAVHHHHHQRAAFVNAIQQNNTLFLSVAQPAQLAAALAQREKPVVIENVPANKTLIFIFNFDIRFGRWWWLGPLLAYAISLGYAAQYSHTEWHPTKTIEDKLILIPHPGADH